MISLAEIEKVAVLARLLLTPAESQQMTEQLGKILEYMSLLNEVNTENVEPLAHAVELTNVFREDRVTPSLDREMALANAPHRDEECYRVPAVLGEV
ncbi:MAG: Asp-tRNA(Asn)/Glu-tRNA(Gln) amidotransferase subunit GatC [Thermogutta sp.]|nr:Asp-tRNA(Asn)/Glu-tRNA(Gln) amidotransferase subunit GatC [Thermogutta sp.]HOP77743.1 Asp-tRNA(Asn)/Glu-tRNA(Gln) amidotransferase subunit GatC [Thermogutta sp.]HPU07321.1 Asp-tRNA(Asn)/Glu-tRNA(Gln) amidotransferase subunit GatC [Thermogutta sp.]HQF13138.1 Asp-tRNA(Asn)/Glu-tRNA(Gln) amidotransferase subunit GatC [Thermogutta sp.]